MIPQPDVVTISTDDVSLDTKPLFQQLRKLPKRVKKLISQIPHQEACTLLVDFFQS